MTIPLNPEFIINRKEYALLKWAAKQKGYKGAGEYTKEVILNDAKQYFLDFKKKKEEAEIKKAETEEVERDKLMNELVESGEIEDQRYAPRKHTKKKVDDSELPPKMEGEVEGGEI